MEIRTAMYDIKEWLDRNVTDETATKDTEILTLRVTIDEVETLRYLSMRTNKAKTRIARELFGIALADAVKQLKGN